MTQTTKDRTICTPLKTAPAREVSEYNLPNKQLTLVRTPN